MTRVAAVDLLLAKNGFLAVPAAVRDEASTERAPAEAELGTVLADMAYFGFAPSHDMVTLLLRLDARGLAAFWAHAQPVLKRATGDDRDMAKVVVYKNFPKEVMEMSEAGYWIRQILMYVGFPNELFTQEEEAREPMGDKLKLRVLDLAGEDIWDRLYAKLMAQGASWQPDQIAAVAEILTHKAPPVVDVAAFRFRANGVLMAVSSWSTPGVRVATTSATDVLRLAAGLSDCDIELKESVRFRRFKRPERRRLVELLAGCADLEGDFARRAEVWKRLLERLHPGDFKVERVSRAYDDLYKGSEGRLAARIEAGFRAKDIRVLEVLASEPGTFLRQLHRAYGAFGPQAFEAFLGVMDALTVEQLLKLQAYLRTSMAPGALEHVREAETAAEVRLGDLLSREQLAKLPPRATQPEADRVRTARLVRPKGNWAKAQLLAIDKPVIAEEDLGSLLSALATEIGRRVDAVLPQGVALDPRAYEVKLVTNGQELASYGRGTEFDIPPEMTFLRTASYWAIKERGTVWFDNGWNFFGEDWSAKGAGCWTQAAYPAHGKDAAATFSGDPVNTRDMKGRACQMIDLYLDRLAEKGVRYAVWNVLCYSNVSFSEAEDVLATLQWGENAETGKLYEPARAQMVFPLKGEGMTKFVAYIDIKRRKLVYMDVGLSGAVSSAEHNTERLSKLMPAFVNYATALPSVGDLFAHAKPGLLPVVRSDEGVAIDGPAWVFERKSQENRVEPLVLENLLALKGLTPVQAQDPALAA